MRFVLVAILVNRQRDFSKLDIGKRVIEFYCGLCGVTGNRLRLW